MRIELLPVWDQTERSIVGLEMQKMNRFRISVSRKYLEKPNNSENMVIMEQIWENLKILMSKLKKKKLESLQLKVNCFDLSLPLNCH